MWPDISYGWQEGTALRRELMKIGKERIDENYMIS